jgi:hypothetical protein
MAPVSNRTDLAHPSIVRVTSRSFIINIKTTPAPRWTNPRRASPFRTANTGLGFGIVGAPAFPLKSAKPRKYIRKFTGIPVEDERVNPGKTYAQYLAIAAKRGSKAAQAELGCARDTE